MRTIPGLNGSYSPFLVKLKSVAALRRPLKPRRSPILKLSNGELFSRLKKNYLISKNLDFIYIDSYHEPLHVEKVFYHYYEFLKINGICVIDDISWLPYCKKEYRDNEFSEIVDRNSLG